MQSGIVTRLLFTVFSSSEGDAGVLKPVDVCLPSWPLSLA